MMASSRPLRFVLLVVGGWIGVRTAMLWPSEGPVRALVQAVAPPLAASTRPHVAVVQRVPVAIRLTPAERAAATFGRLVPDAVPNRRFEPALALVSEVPVDAPQIEEASAFPGAPLTPVRETPRRATVMPEMPSRLGGSAWLIARGSGTGAPFAPQLGGSQAGARLTYALGDARRLAIAARVSSALGMRQREAAVGLDWRPTSLPLHLVAEQRIGIDGARGGPALGLIAGLAPVPVAAGFALEGYGQAGVIGRGRGEGYADGAVRAMRRVASRGAARIEAGFGLWGGAQRGASRIDVGPSASIVVPAPRPIRVSLEWRQRIVGNARPGSGPALSLGSDF